MTTPQRGRVWGALVYGGGFLGSAFLVGSLLIYLGPKPPDPCGLAGELVRSLQQCENARNCRYTADDVHQLNHYVQQCLESVVAR